MKKDKEKMLNGQEEQNYRDEMDELARIFKEELDKAVAEAEDASDFEDIDKVEVEGYNPKEVAVEEKTEKQEKSKKKEKKQYLEEELCDCCGERPRGTKKNPDSIFCEECEAILEKYPYDWKGILTAVVVIGFMLYSLIMFIGEVPVFANAVRGDQALKDGKIYTALYKYEMAFTHLANNDDIELAQEYKGLFAKHIMAQYRANAINDVWAESEAFFTKKELNMPWYKDIKAAYEETERATISKEAVYGIHLAEYDDVNITKEDIAKDYDKIIAIIDGLSGKKVYEKNGMYYDETQADFKPDGTETVYVYDEAILSLCKYTVAIASEKSPDVVAAHLEEIGTIPTCMSEFIKTNLAVAYARMGKYVEAEKLANELRANNCETNSYYYVMSMVYRYRDKDYNKAVQTCVDGLMMLSSLNNAETIICIEGKYLSMQKTLAYKNAYDSANEYLEYENAYQTEVLGYSESQVTFTPAAYDLYIMLAIQTNDTEVVESYDKEIEELGDDAFVYEHITSYRNGEMTLEEIVMTGRYDWQ